MSDAVAGGDPTSVAPVIVVDSRHRQRHALGVQPQCHAMRQGGAGCTSATWPILVARSDHDRALLSGAGDKTMPDPPLAGPRRSEDGVVPYALERTPSSLVASP